MKNHFQLLFGWMSLPSSRAPMVAHVRRMLTKVLESCFTPNNLIFIKVSRSLENSFYAYPTIIVFMNFYLHHSPYQIVLEPWVYSFTFCIHGYHGNQNHNIWWKTILNYSMMDVHTFLVAHARRMLEKVATYGFTPKKEICIYNFDPFLFLQWILNSN